MGTRSRSGSVRAATAVVAALLPLVAVAPPAQAAPDPAAFFIESLTYGGTGCPQGSVGQSLADDRTAFTLIFDSFVASTGSGVPVSESRKFCQVDIALHVPPGVAWAVASLDSRGYVQLPAGVQATRKSTLFVQGTPVASAQSDFVGPVANDYLVRDVTPTLDFDTGACANGNTVPLSVLDQVRIDGPASSSAQVTLDSLDGKVATEPGGPGAGLTIEARRCGPPDPTTSYLQSVSYGGTGCPAGTTGALFSAQRTNLDMVYDGFVARTGSGIPVTESRKNCQHNLNLSIPDDWGWLRVELDQRGYAGIPEGTAAGLSSTFFFGGELLGDPVAATIGGQCRADYLYRVRTPNFDVTAAAGSVVPVNWNQQVRLTGLASTRALLTLDSIDLRVVGGPGPAPADVPSELVGACSSPPTITAAATTADGNAYIAGSLTNQPVTVTFTCAGGASPVASCSPPVTYSADGTFTAEGTVTDEAGTSVSVELGPIVIDRTLPTCSASATPSQLWPANKKMVPVTVAVSSSDGAARLVSLASDEGNVAADQQGFAVGTMGPFAGKLRADRAGQGPGRVYTLTFEVADAAGNTGQCTATVTVPHDQGH